MFLIEEIINQPSGIKKIQPFSDVYHPCLTVARFFQELQCNYVTNHLHGQLLAGIGGPFPSTQEVMTLHLLRKALLQEVVKRHYHLQPSITGDLFPAIANMISYGKVNRIR